MTERDDPTVAAGQYAKVQIHFPTIYSAATCCMSPSFRSLAIFLCEHLAEGPLAFVV